MMRIDDTLVVYEGRPRLRWAHHPSWAHSPDDVDRTEPAVYVDHVWPTNETRTYVRRQIAHGQKLLVIVDAADAGAVVTSCAQPPKIPPAAVELSSRRDTKRSSRIELFDWLSAADRERGLAFVSHVSMTGARSRLGAASPFYFEEALVGSDHSLRFLVQSRSLELSAVRALIGHLWNRGADRAYRHADRRYVMDLQWDGQNVA